MASMCISCPTAQFMPMKIMSHFSQIDVESKLGEGTTFTITLPCDILATDPHGQ